MGLKNFLKSPGQLRTEAQTRKTIAKVKEKQATLRAMKGGQVAGLSSSAASGLASDPAMFNGGAKKKSGFR